MLMNFFITFSFDFGYIIGRPVLLDWVSSWQIIWLKYIYYKYFNVLMRTKSTEILIVS